MTVSDVGTPAVGVPAIWGRVPQRNKNFTGRDDILTRLQQGAASKITAVLPEDPMPKALQGLGGVGKTAIAIEFAYRHRRDYDLVWWIPADQIPLVRAALAALAAEIGLEAAKTTGIEAAAAAALDALRRGEPFRRWLLIFDNADQPEDIMDLIPQGGPGDVLITSRNHRWQSVIDTVPMNVFSRAESKEFLIKRVPKGLSESDAERLANALGDLPLALEQAGAMLAETGMPVDEYLRLLDEHIGGILSEGKSPDYPLSMTAAWRLSVKTLQEQLPQARELLRCCAFFGPEPIPRDVFRRGTPAAATGIGGVISDPIVLARVIRELGRFALVTIDGRSITVHRLVQALLRDELTDEARGRYRHDVHLILAAADPKNPDDERLWPRYRELVAHMASATTELAGCKVHEVRQFALNVMRYLYNSGDLTSCQLLAERFIAQWTQDSGQESPDVLGARRHLGNALRRLGKYRESYEMTQTTLGAASRILGDRESLTLSLRRSFGADLRARGDFAAARELDEQTRGLLEEEAYGQTNPQVLALLASLALDYGLNSAYVDARDLYQRVYVLMSEASPDIPAADMLGAWNGLGWAVRLCGNYAEARDVSEDAWDYGRERLGPDHVATLRSATGVSIASRRILAAREDGLKIARDTFEMCTRLFGDSNPDSMAAAISLTNMQRTIGRLDEAVGLAEQTVAQYPDVYGPQHPYNFGCMGNLALLRRVTGHPESARELNEQALAGLDERLTRDHHYTLTVAVNLASDLATIGLTSDARALGEGTLRRLRARLGEDHPVTLGCAANLSVDLRADGAVEAAEALKAQTLARYAATLGSDHPDALVASADQRLDLDFDPAPI
jgi:tetratricopeptide (TPR) repeat protein